MTAIVAGACVEMGITESRNPLHGSRAKNYHVVFDIQDKDDKCYVIGNSSERSKSSGQTYVRRCSPVFRSPTAKVLPPRSFSDEGQNGNSHWFVDVPCPDNAETIPTNDNVPSPFKCNWKSEPELRCGDKSGWDFLPVLPKHDPISRLPKSLSMWVLANRKRAKPALAKNVCDRSDCNYTCHEQCKQSISVESSPDLVEAAGESGSSIEEKLAKKECFHGLIRVHMNLTGPINIVAGTRPPSTYDMVKKDDTIDRTLTSFYLPRDTMKSLHVTNETTAQEVVSGLLKKFKVVDNPARFALYERDFEPDGISKVKLRRLNSEEKPLCMVLNWTETQRNFKSFVLQENDMMDISWESFSIPELQNFLRILDREQQEYENQIREKYESRRRRLNEALSKLSCHSKEVISPSESSKVS